MLQVALEGFGKVTGQGGEEFPRRWELGTARRAESFSFGTGGQGSH